VTTVRHKFTGELGQVTRIYFEQYPENRYHTLCVDLTKYGYPPAMLIPRVEVKLPRSTFTIDADGFSHYFEKL
jgi:hypothetical protein